MCLDKKALAYHNAQLEASAFREEFDPESFEDLTEPKYEMIHKVSHSLDWIAKHYNVYDCLP
jgi:hypothetical protein